MSQIPTGFHERDARRVAAATRLVEKMPRVVEGGDFGTPVQPPGVSPGGGSPSYMFWIRILSADSLGGRKWAYNWERVRRTSTGWEAHPSGLASTDGSGDTADTRALNSLEAPNASGGTGVQGNGIDAANLVGSFDLVPIGEGAVCMCWVDVVEGESFYTICVPNQVDGGCA